MELTQEDIRNLLAIRDRIRVTFKVVQRKRKLRDSERAMWAAELTAQALTVTKLIEHGKVGN